MIRRCIYLVGLLLLTGIGMPLSADEPREATLVLVSGANFGGRRLTPNQLRRVFLGISVSVNGYDIRALRNTSDPALNEIFLQKVVYMSGRRYERQLVSQTFRTGQVRPPQFDTHRDLVQGLKSRAGSVTVMWKRDARKEGDLQIVQVLWKGRTR